jgi:ribA/ribD-fused uncharacterized protein
MNKDEIAGFFLDGWYVFDSYAPFQIEWRGKLWPTAEHAFQAAHFFETNPDLAEQVRLMKSPRQADDFANENKQFDDPSWREKRVAIMEEIVRVKYEQHPLIQETLRKSGTMSIVETNENDLFWGWGPDGKGENMLGKIWMKLRDEVTKIIANV